MPDNPDKPRSPFPTTHWSLVKKVQRGSAEDAWRAMEDICRGYWYPIYSYLRRCGHAPADAEDLTQDFFQRVIEEKSILGADEARGKLRSFLLGVLKRLLSDHFRALGREKRGGGRHIVSFDDEEAEGRYQREPADLKSPDALFDRAWAEGVLHSALAKLRTASIEADDVALFDQVSEYLPLGDNATPYREAAARVKLSEGALRLQIHRMRKRYAKLIEEEIALTVDDEADIQAEREHLLRVMGR
jgi:RNA polymerase sigma-70 factor (ECF subfamily)